MELWLYTSGRRSSPAVQPGLLVPGQQIFEFIPLKDGFIFHCEILLVLEW